MRATKRKRTPTPLLNSLDRQEFTAWLEDLADRGEIAGSSSGISQIGSPLQVFLANKGVNGYVGRFEFFPAAGHAGRGAHRLPGWAVEFSELLEAEPYDDEDVEEDGITRLISAERCMEIMEEIP